MRGEDKRMRTSRLTSITVSSRVQDLGYPVSNKKENYQIYSGAKGLNHYFSNEGIRVAKRYVKICSVSPASERCRLQQL